MTKYQIVIDTKAEPNTFTVLKRKYWITFLDFGWEKLVETSNINELRQYLPENIEMLRDDTKE